MGIAETEAAAQSAAAPIEGADPARVAESGPSRLEALALARARRLEQREALRAQNLLAVAHLRKRGRFGRERLV